MPRAKDIIADTRNIRQNKDGTYTIQGRDDKGSFVIKTDSVNTGDIGTLIRKRETYIEGEYDIAPYLTKVELEFETQEFTKKVKGKDVTYKSKVLVGAKIIHGGWENGQTTIQGKHYRYKVGAGRLDNGFVTLATQLKWGGVDPDKVDMLLKIWEGLTDKQKAEVFNRYRVSGLVLTYGSGAISETQRDFDTTAESYYNVIYNIVQKVRVGE